jgi:hypothetical protein
MTAIDRRRMLTLLLGGAAAAAAGVALAGPAESAPLSVPMSPAAEPENLIEKAVVYVRRRRRKVCWWRRGRRVCRWRRY